MNVLMLALLLSHAPINKTKLAMHASCTDPVGTLLVYHLREEIRQSSGYELDDAAPLAITMICIDDSVGGDGLSSAASFLVLGTYKSKDCDWTWIVAHQVVDVGRDKTKFMASRLLAAVDNALH